MSAVSSLPPNEELPQSPSAVPTTFDDDPPVWEDIKEFSWVTAHRDAVAHPKPSSGKRAPDSVSLKLLTADVEDLRDEVSISQSSFKSHSQFLVEEQSIGGLFSIFFQVKIITTSPSAAKVLCTCVQDESSLHDT